MNHIELGHSGERLAREHIVAKGHQIIDKNYRWKNWELDIISLDKKVLVISEVKTRNSDYFGEPFQSVTRSKQRQIIRTTNKYMEEKGLDLEIRFDVISIVLNKKGSKIEHIESAFYPLL